MAFMGVTPFGYLLGGAVAARIGAPRTLAISGILCIAASAAYFAALPSIRRALRPIYIELGILPQPGIEAVQSVDSAPH